MAIRHFVAHRRADRMSLPVMEATEREVVYLILLFTKDTFTMLDFRYFRNLGALAVAAMAYAAAPTTAKAGPVTYLILLALRSPRAPGHMEPKPP
jgi:hypothetical protein